MDDTAESVTPTSVCREPLPATWHIPLELRYPGPTHTIRSRTRNVPQEKISGLGLATMP